MCVCLHRKQTVQCCGRRERGRELLFRSYPDYGIKQGYSRPYKERREKKRLLKSFLFLCLERAGTRAACMCKKSWLSLRHMVYQPTKHWPDSCLPQMLRPCARDFLHFRQKREPLLRHGKLLHYTTNRLRRRRRRGQLVEMAASSFKQQPAAGGLSLKRGNGVVAVVVLERPFPVCKRRRRRPPSSRPAKERKIGCLPNSAATLLTVCLFVCSF